MGGGRREQRGDRKAEKGNSDLDAVWEADSCGPKEPCVRWRSRSPTKRDSGCFLRTAYIQDPAATYVEHCTQISQSLRLVTYTLSHSSDHESL